MNILVTGGARYIGSHVCKCYSARGSLPVAYDNLSRGRPTAVKWGPLEIGDIEDRDKFRAVCRSRSRTPGPPPCSSMNSTRATLMFSSVTSSKLGSFRNSLRTLFLLLPFP